MDSKLTLKLNSRAIDRAKSYAEKNHTSLSKMVEDYFQVLTEDVKPRSIKISPLVKEVSGIIDLENDFNYKDSYAKYLVDKYK